jgi:hypothetical protein
VQTHAECQPIVECRTAAATIIGPELGENPGRKFLGDRLAGYKFRQLVQGTSSRAGTVYIYFQNATTMTTAKRTRTQRTATAATTARQESCGDLWAARQGPGGWSITASSGGRGFRRRPRGASQGRRHCRRQRRCPNCWTAMCRRLVTL